eukprot:COSAG05_NODE_1952_length_3792_cov_7.187111_2_plen_65_part_00
MEKSCRLLLLICRDNLAAAQKLYRTGVFFFMLMCVLPSSRQLPHICSGRPCYIHGASKWNILLW